MTANRTSKGMPLVPPVIRPLVIPTSAPLGSSLIGLIATATAANVLGTTRVILDEVGPRLPRPGLVGQEFVAYTKRLALKLGCKHDDVLQLMHPYLTSPSDKHVRAGGWNKTVRWGGGTIERHHLDLSTRWISPSALEISPHHRAAWLCKLLPYCTETLELLVGHCGLCDTRLGWTHARGIGTCEHCRQPIAPSSASPLPASYTDSYLRFAALVSVDDAIREAERIRLGSPLRGMTQTDLTRLIIGLGRALDPGSGRYDNSILVERSDPSIAKTVARGFALLTDWPHKLRASLQELTSGPSPEIGPRDMKARISGVSGYRLANPAHQDLLRDAVPELFGHHHRSMNFSEPVVLASESCKLIGISIARFRELEDQGHITGTETTVGQRKYNQYSQRRVEEIAKAWRSSSRASAIESYLGVPRYGVEQLVCLDLLHQERDPAVNALDENLRLTDLSISELQMNLEAVVIRDTPPEDAISLRRLSRWCGGDMKPWGPAIEVLLSGQTECWLDPKTEHPLPRSSQFVDRTLVRQADASKLFDAQFERRRYPAFSFSKFLCQEDASDILNADFAQLQPATVAGDLIFKRRKGNGQWVDLAAVLALARRTITAGELSHLTGQHCNFVKNLLPRILRIRRAVLGWDRQDLLANWAEVIAIIETANTPDSPRRAASMKLPLGYADASRLRLQASLGPPD